MQSPTWLAAAPICRNKPRKEKRLNHLSDPRCGTQSMQSPDKAGREAGSQNRKHRRRPFRTPGPGRLHYALKDLPGDLETSYSLRHERAGLFVSRDTQTATGSQRKSRVLNSTTLVHGLVRFYWAYRVLHTLRGHLTQNFASPPVIAHHARGTLQAAAITRPQPPHSSRNYRLPKQRKREGDRCKSQLVTGPRLTSSPGHQPRRLALLHSLVFSAHTIS
ncbi:hypothetical protein VTG60DRAFT_1973 [Thermothelomyces hinnuleus]